MLWLGRGLSAFYSCLEIFPETEIKGCGLINLVKGISGQSNAEVVAWLLLGPFSQIVNQEQRVQQGDLKYYKFDQGKMLQQGWTVNPDLRS